MATLEGPAAGARNSLRDAVEPVYMVMRWFAAWPAARPQGTGLPGLASALPVAGQALLLALLAYLWTDVLHDRLAFFGSGLAGEARTVIAIQCVMYLAAFWTLPLVWRDALRLAGVVERWGVYQAELEYACRGGPGGGRLSSSRAASLASMVALCAAWPPFLMAPLCLLPEAAMRAEHAAFFALCTLTVMSLKLLWWRMLRALDQAADLLVTTFQKGSQAHYALPDRVADAARARRLRTFRRLWMSLRDVLEDVGLKGGTSMLVIQAMQALSLLLFSVQTVLAVIQGFSPVTQWMAVLGVVTLTTSGTLCDAGQRVSDKMQKVAVLLESTSATNLGPAVKYEMEVFRQNIIYKSVAIRLCGFVPLNRSFLGSVLVVLLTYLMVLLQFALL